MEIFEVLGFMVPPEDPETLKHGQKCQASNPNTKIPNLLE
jgi:hypothetical protein